MGFFSNVKANIDGGIGNFKMKWDDASRSYDDEDDMVDDIDDDEDDECDDGEPVTKGKIIRKCRISSVAVATNAPKTPVSALAKLNITNDQLITTLPIAICDVFGCDPVIGTATASIILKIADDADNSKLHSLDVDTIAKIAASFGYDANTVVTVLSIIDKLDNTDVCEKIVSALKSRTAKPMTVGMNFNGVGQQPILVG